MSNTADPSFREVKPRHGGPERSTASLFRLDDRTIVISGGAGYLGMEVAGAVLECGGDVVLMDVVDAPPKHAWDQLQLLADKVRRLAVYLKADVTSSENVRHVLDVLVKSYIPHPISGLVTCAGVSDNDPATEFSTERFRRLMDINVTGTFVVAQAVAELMRKEDVSGSMVFVASMSGTVANKGVDTAAYNASKSAVLQLARSLAAEWGSRKGMPLIRVNTLSPGYIMTPATEGALQKPGMKQQWEGDNMLYRLSQPDEFRAPVIFLLADGSSFMTGADLRVDGGHCAW
ncbi:dehydrogenase with different specificitie [Neohortaea acidophila]|uniref:Dehydrogenase with different specificitie n=1 Tax=Neohortaea acidophila TaxID=245834 RepID=A0A6A6Q1D4_9PEZI|nr:dehydrogenase with different specificitie [Neohortaea acidophila]KAF2485799.1 dehydrogenase with different specificitie [Neohortaea acidophila]